jgi:hypothetical protein
MNLSQDKIIEIMMEANFWREDRFCRVAAYLNLSIQPIATLRLIFSLE